MMELPPLEYTFDNVVLGWREEAVSFAREHGYHLIVNSDQRPFYYSFGLQDVKSRWYEGIFDLGLRSLLPIPFDVERISMEEGRLRVVTKGKTKVLIDFKILHIFDVDNFSHLGVEEKVEDYIVHDMFDVVHGSRQPSEILLSLKDSFIKTIEFVSSNRIDRNTQGDFKDIVATSIIRAADLTNFDFSETIIRLLVERTLKEHKVKQSNGRNLKIEHSCRHAIKNRFRFNVVESLDKRIILYE